MAVAAIANMSRANMSRRALPVAIAVVVMALSTHGPAAAQDAAALEKAIASSARSERNRVRDVFRHPKEVISFFGIMPDSAVVEILPGSGAYFMEILAPYVKDKGKFYAANRDEAAPANYLKDHQRMLDKIKANPQTLGAIVVTQFNAGKHAIAPAGSADFVLTFRNLHNWIDRNELEGSLQAFRAALKPGGVLGVVDHRGRTDLSQEQQHKTGYVRQDAAIKLIEKAGFKFAGSSEANANPKDTKDHPAGVWSLPPSYRLKDKNRAKYTAIGESDRFTLKFVKQ